MDSAAETIPRKVGAEKRSDPDSNPESWLARPLDFFLQTYHKDLHTHDGGWVDKSKLQMKNINVFTDKALLDLTSVIINL